MPGDVYNLQNQSINIIVSRGQTSPSTQDQFAINLDGMLQYTASLSYAHDFGWMPYIS